MSEMVSQVDGQETTNALEPGRRSLVVINSHRVLNDELRGMFRKWYLNFIQEDVNQRKAA